MINNKLQVGFFTLLITLVAALSFLVLKPYLAALFIALILRITFEPVHVKIARFIRGRENLSALISTFTVVVFIVLPFVLVGFFLFDSVHNLYTRIADGNIDFRFLDQLVLPIQDFVRGFVPDFSIDPLQYARQGLTFLLAHVGSIFSSAVSLGFNFLLMLLGLFYFFRDGDRFRKNIIFLSPLSNNYDESILNKVTDALSSVVRGSLLIALIQGILAAIGFLMFGVPNPVLWGAVAAVAALVPNLGTTLVLLPAIIFLFWSGAFVPAIGLLIWGVVIVGLVDNLLAPYLMTRGLKVHPFLILLSVLGGIWFFGPVGFLAGPVLVALFMTLLDMYPSIVSGKSL